MSFLQVPHREQNRLNEHGLLEIPFRVVRAVAFCADGFKPDGAGLPGHAHVVAGVDVADLPDMHGLLVVGQEFHFRKGTGAAGRFQPVERPCLPAFVTAYGFTPGYSSASRHDRRVGPHNWA